MFAVIETGGKQYKVVEQDIIFVEKLEVAEGDEIVFDSVMALSTNDGFKVGTPTVAGAKVTAKVLKNGKNKKIYVFKYKSKKNEKKKIGHRQPFINEALDTLPLILARIVGHLQNCTNIVLDG